MAEQQADLLGPGSYTDDLVKNLDQVPVEVRQKWPKDLVALVDIYQNELQRMGLEENLCNKISISLLLAQANYGGGRYFYLPKGDKLRNAVRDYKIWKDFNGQNVDQLVDKYKLTAQRIYAIISEQRALDIKRRQPGLF